MQSREPSDPHESSYKHLIAEGYTQPGRGDDGSLPLLPYLSAGLGNLGDRQRGGVGCKDT